MKAMTRGLVAGLVATVVLSALMIIKDATGFMPEISTIEILGALMGTGATPVAAWIVHALIGTVAWGLAYALLEPYLPGGSGWLKGVAFATTPWFLMMVVVLPLAEVGFYGLDLSLVTPVVLLALHLIYGAVLGFTYGALPAERRAAAAEAPPAGAADGCEAPPASSGRRRGGRRRR